MILKEYIRALVEAELAEIEEQSRIVEPKRSGLTMAQLGMLPNGGVQNIIAVFNQATPGERDYWGKWYHSAKEDVQEMAQHFNLPFPVMAAIVAVLSPGNKWNSNLLAAEKLLKNDPKINAYPRQTIRARKILEMGDTSLVTGPKVTVFYKSLMDPTSVEKDMVLDGHAINIWRGKKANLKGLRNPSSKERAQMVADYQTAAMELGVSVQAVQATTWYIWKYTADSASVEIPQGKFDVSKFKGFMEPANDNANVTRMKELPEANGLAGGAVVGYGGPLGMDTKPGKKILWSGDKPESYHPKNESFFRQAEPTSEPGFFYHATSIENIWGIVDSGEMEVHLPDFGSEQDEWPDGSTEERSYFGTSTKHVEPFYPHQGKAAIIRVPVGAVKFKKERGTGDIYTTQNIPASVIQAWSEKDASWVPLGSDALSENVLDDMGQKHVGGVKRRAPYSLSDPPSMGISIPRASLLAKK